MIPPTRTNMFRPITAHPTTREIDTIPTFLGAPPAPMQTDIIEKARHYEGMCIPEGFSVELYNPPSGNHFKIVGIKDPHHPSIFHAIDPGTHNSIAILKEVHLRTERRNLSPSPFSASPSERKVWIQCDTEHRAINAHTYSLQDATLYTAISPLIISAKQNLELTEQEMSKLFNITNEELTSVSTTLAKDTLDFTNYYGAKIWIMASNYRDKSAAAFHMNDIIKMQSQLAGRKGSDISYLVRRYIEPATMQAFQAKHQLDHLDTMTDDQLSEFTSSTVNGQSSVRILSDYGLRAVSAQVIWDEDGEYMSVALKTAAEPTDTFYRPMDV